MSNPNPVITQGFIDAQRKPLYERRMTRQILVKVPDVIWKRLEMMKVQNKNEFARLAIEGRLDFLESATTEPVAPKRKRGRPPKSTRRESSGERS